MNEPDLLSTAMRAERDSLAALAPASEFAALWHDVMARRERRLQVVLMLAAAIPTLTLFLGGLVSLLLGGGLASGLPLVALALWLVVNGAADPLALPSTARLGGLRRAGD